MSYFILRISVTISFLSFIFLIVLFTLQLLASITNIALLYAFLEVVTLPFWSILQIHKSLFPFHFSLSMINADFFPDTILTCADLLWNTSCFRFFYRRVLTTSCFQLQFPVRDHWYLVYLQATWYYFLVLSFNLFRFSLSFYKYCTILLPYHCPLIGILLHVQL